MEVHASGSWDRICVFAGQPGGANQPWSIEYIGYLALAMRDQQTRAFQQFAGLVTELDTVFPGAKDVINIDRALPDIAFSFGLKAEHLSTQEEIEAAREARQVALERKEVLEMAQVAGQAYPGATKSPESDSPAEALMGV